MHFLQKNWKIFTLACLFALNGALALYVFSTQNSLVDETQDEAQYEKSLLAVKDAGTGFGELSKFFLRLAEDRGAVYAFEILKRAEIPPNIDMHLLGHVVGDELYKQQGIEGMKHCTHDFRNACSHTVVIGALLENGLGVFDEIHEVCKKAPGGSGAYTMCFHGFGHGVLAYAEYEVPDAVELCQRVGTEAYANREFAECAGGVTMEMISGVHDRELWAEKRKKYMPGDNPLELCTSGAYPDEVKNMCLVYITPELFTAAGAELGDPDPVSFEKAFTFCDQLPENDTRGRDACYGGFGKEFTVLAQDRDIRNMNNISNEKLGMVYQWCGNAGNEKGEHACRTHALNSLYWGGENDPDVSIRFCSVMEREDADECYSDLINSVAFYVSDAEYREQFCSALPEHLTSQCSTRLQ